MKELTMQAQIFPGQLDVSLIILSYIVSRNLRKLDPNPSSLLNNVFDPAKFEFQNQAQAEEIVLNAVKSTLDVLWDQSNPKNAKERQLIDKLNLLKNQGVSRAAIIERLSLHFRWGLNSQKT